MKITVEEKYQELYDNSIRRSKERFNYLLKNLDLDHTCAFIGAGPSLPLEYPSLSTIIETFERETERNFRGKDYTVQIQQHRDNIKNEARYREILAALFRNKEPYRPVHINLLEIGFEAYITTNYDLCLENATPYAKKQPGISYYPILDYKNFSNGHIFHIHGVIDPSDPELELAKSIVLSSQDYTDAYQAGTELVRFLQNVFYFQSVIFFGFGFNEEEKIFSILKNAHYDRQNQKRLLSQMGWGNRDIFRYAFMPFPIIKSLEVSENIEILDGKKLIEQESMLEEYNIEVIRYLALESNHMALSKYVEKIRDKVIGKPIVKSMPIAPEILQSPRIDS